MTTVLMCLQGIPFQVSPTRTQTINELRQRGSDVIIFFPGKVKDENLKKQVKRIVNTSVMNDRKIRSIIKEINPDIVICSTVEDTNICFCLPYIMKHTDFYYYNLEIYVPDADRDAYREKYSICKRMTTNVIYAFNKLKEVLYARGCRSIVIQDRLRKKILKKYCIAHPKTWLIPNSYYMEKNGYTGLRKNGLIYSGTVCSHMLGAFVSNAEEIKDVEITISGWGYPDLRLKKNPNIKIVKQNLTQDEYTKFISGYDIALIWYSNNYDENMHNIGLASGKFFKHLSLGQPVIVNNAPGLADEVRKYKLGVVINDVGELKDAADAIKLKYDYYVQNIKKTYEKRYDYKKASRRFFDDIVDNAKGYARAGSWTQKEFAERLTKVLDKA